MTLNGGSNVHTRVDVLNEGRFIFALLQSVICSYENLGGNYSGLLLDDKQSSADKIPLVAMSYAFGTCTATIVEDAELGTLSNGSVDIALI